MGPTFGEGTIPSADPTSASTHTHTFCSEGTRSDLTQPAVSVSYSMGGEPLNKRRKSMMHPVLDTIESALCNSIAQIIPALINKAKREEEITQRLSLSLYLFY